MNMIRVISKLIIGIFPLILSTKAEDSQQSDKPYYLGVSLGRDTTIAQARTGGVAPTPAVNTPSKNTISFRNFSFGCFFGVGEEIKPLRIYLGAEVAPEFYNAGNNSENLFANGASNSNSFSVKSKNSVSLVLRAGKIFYEDRLLLYAKAGAIWSIYRLSASVAASTLLAEGNASTERKQSFFQPLVGFGVEGVIKKTESYNVLLGAEVQWALKRSIPLSLNSNSFSGGTTYNIDSNSIKVRLILRF